MHCQQQGRTELLQPGANCSWYFLLFFSTLLQVSLMINKNRCEHFIHNKAFIICLVLLQVQVLMFSVAAKEMHKAPSFIEKLQNTSVGEGYPVRLECRVSGVPFPQIFWKKENESITHNTDRIRYLPIVTQLKQFHQSQCTNRNYRTTDAGNK